MIKISLMVIAIGSLVLGFTVSSSAECGPCPQTRTIDVTGQGEVKASPDTAELAIAIETLGPTAAAAASENATQTQKVVEALKSKLGDKGKVTTSGYALFPQYSERPAAEKPRVTGFRAQNSINVEVQALELAGPIIDAAIAAGANRVDSLSFKLRDEAAERRNAIDIAAKDAASQAQTLASALGLRLKRIMHASTGGEPRPIPVRFAATSMMAAA